EAVVELQSAHAQLAGGVGKHSLIPQLVREIAREINAGGIRRPEEFVADEAAGHGKAEREAGFHASRAGKRGDARPHSEKLAELVIYMAGQHHLRTLAHGWVGCPGPEIVSELWVDDPSQKLELQLLQLHVLALDHGNNLAEPVGVILGERQLVQIA